MGEFVHLHLHTEYSLLDGAARIKRGKASPLVDALKAKGMKAAAITDHGNMYGVYAFVEALRGAGIKPIIGSEFYVAENLTQKDPREVRYHLILLAKNNEGYANLMKLSSIAFIDGFYYKPRIDLDTLSQYSKGIICLTACIQGQVPRLILENNYEGAKRVAIRMRDMFEKGDFYVELQNHGIEEQLIVNPQLVRLAKEIGVKTVATNDVHYLEKSDADMQDVLMCISTKKKASDIERMKLEPQEFYLKSYDEMLEKFQWCPEALDTTLEIADKCNVDVKTHAEPGHYEIPVFEIKDKKYDGLTDREKTDAYLRDMTYEGLKNRYGTITPEVRDRAEKELNIIINMGFSGYYLIVWDFIHYSRKNGIPVGPGRGSGVGSIVAYAIGITNVEPLRYNLLFERFLNPERISMPDFDVDFCTERRGEVIKYVSDKYGADHVAQIITYGTLSARAVIKDVARVYDMSYSDADKLAKAVPNVLKITIAKALGLEKSNDDDAQKMLSPDLIKYYEEDDSAHRVIDMAMRLENLPRQTGMHAAGVLICPKPVWNYVPLQRSGDFITTQFDKKQVEEMGLLKMDFLGLSTLTDINLANDYIEQTTGKRVDFDKISYDDPEVYNLISNGDTKAIFQIEKGGMTRFMTKLRPDCLEEIIAGIALYRPGPMQFIEKYISGKKNPDKVEYLHPKLKSILDITYGCIVYQEQVMQIAREIAGYTFGGADGLRRAMGKKDAEKMKSNKQIFIYGKTNDKGEVIIDGAVRRGVSAEIAGKLFDQILEFANYAFNKSHAAAYSVVAYQTAYLKRYYRLCFMCAVLNNRITNADEVSEYVNYLIASGTEVLPPDINKSEVKFSIEGDKLRFGLMAIKNVGQGAAEAAVMERRTGGDFSDLEDFVGRVSAQNLNKRTVESMIKGGAFDKFGLTRSTLTAAYEQVMDIAAKEQKQRAAGQISLFDVLDDGFSKFKYTLLEEYPQNELLAAEKEVLGLYMSGHPLQAYRNAFLKYDFNLGDLKLEDAEIEVDEEAADDAAQAKYDTSYNNKSVTLGGLVSQVSKKVSNSGKNMAIGVLEDLHGQIEFMVYDRTYEAYRELLYENSIVEMEGKLSVEEGDQPKLRVFKVSAIEHGDEAAKFAAADLLEDAPKMAVISIQGEQDHVRALLTEVRKVAAAADKGRDILRVCLNGHSYDLPERIRLTSEAVYDLVVLAGRNNVNVK